MKVISIASLKGGVGKTTLSIYLGASIQKVFPNKKVLLVDADPNNNLTDFFLREETVEALEERNLFTVLVGESRLDESIRVIDNLYILPATPDLAGAHLELSNDPSSMIRFRKNLEIFCETNKIDFVIFDTPPSLTYELFLALHLSTSVICPIGFSRWTLQGFKLIDRACRKLEAPDPICVPFNVSQKDAERIYDSGLQNVTKSFVPKSAQFVKSATLGKIFSESLDIWDDLEKLVKEVL